MSDTIIPRFSMIAEVDAADMFEDETSIDWLYCMKHATFSHKEACEFIIHSSDEEYVDSRAEEMKKFGCTDKFINAYKLAAASGAIRVLFWT